jgi:hypothetical protein
MVISCILLNVKQTITVSDLVLCELFLIFEKPNCKIQRSWRTFRSFENVVLFLNKSEFRPTGFNNNELIFLYWRSVLHCSQSVPYLACLIFHQVAISDILQRKLVALLNMQFIWMNQKYSWSYSPVYDRHLHYKTQTVNAVKENCIPIIMPNVSVFCGPNPKILGFFLLGSFGN